MERANCPAYDDFEPYCKWERDGAEDVLIMHLPDFKRNELKIQINKYGLLTVSGECQPAKGASTVSRFTKRVRISGDFYDEDKIHAKFISGILHITMPRKVLNCRNYDQVDHIPNFKKGNEISNMPPLEDADEVIGPGTMQGKKNVAETLRKEMSYLFGLIRDFTSDRKNGKKVAVVVSAVAASSLGASVAYRFWSGSKKT